MSTESMGNVHGFSGQFPWTWLTLSMDIVQSNRSNTPAGQCPWKMSTETMDILQTGLLIDTHIICLYGELSVIEAKLYHYLSNTFMSLFSHVACNVSLRYCNKDLKL